MYNPVVIAPMAAADGLMHGKRDFCCNDNCYEHRYCRQVPGAKP